MIAQILSSCTNTQILRSSDDSLEFIEKVTVKKWKKHQRTRNPFQLHQYYQQLQADWINVHGDVKVSHAEWKNDFL